MAISRAMVGDRNLHSIHIGDVFASRAPSVVRTILGSCISVCLRDPVTGAGGMNHFMLPSGLLDDQVSARYGIHAMELLINECMRQGADRRRMEAKVFGGGHVLRVRETDGNVPQSNIRFVLDFLETEDIPIVARDLGGYSAREIYFFTDNGKILLRRLGDTGDKSRRELTELEREEREKLRSMVRTEVKPAAENITLF